MKFYASSLTPLRKVLISSRRRWNNVKLILLMKHLLCFFVLHTHLPCSLVVFIEYLRVVKQSMHSLMCMTVKLIHYIFHLVLFLIVFLILLSLFLVLVLFILEVILFVNFILTLVHYRSSLQYLNLNLLLNHFPGYFIPISYHCFYSSSFYFTTSSV